MNLENKDKISKLLNDLNKIEGIKKVLIHAKNNPNYFSLNKPGYKCREGDPISNALNISIPNSIWEKIYPSIVSELDRIKANIPEKVPTKI